MVLFDVSVCCCWLLLYLFVVRVRRGRPVLPLPRRYIYLLRPFVRRFVFVREWAR